MKELPTGWGMLPLVKASLQRVIRRGGGVVWQCSTLRLADALHERLVHDHGEKVWKHGLQLAVDRARDREDGWTFDLVLVQRPRQDNPLDMLLPAASPAAGPHSPAPVAHTQKRGGNSG